MATYSDHQQRQLDQASGAALDRVRQKPKPGALGPRVLAQRIAHEDYVDGVDYSWSETETAYGGGGLRINRTRLAELIEAAICGDL